MHRDNNELGPAESTRGSKRFILGLFLLFRWLNASLTKTFDNPDEFWQSTEVAHRLVFGSGYLTWEWIHGIRSYFHPLIFAGLYKLMQICHLDTPSLMVSAPKYLQASLSALGDVATYTLAKKIYGNQLAPFILFVLLDSWFHFLMAARTLSNTLETVFTMLAMQHWPFPGMANQKLSTYRKSLLWASLACITRPTNALIWIFLGLQLLHYAPTYRQKWTIFANAALIVSLILGMNVILDTYIYTGQLFDYQQLVFVPWAFIHTNIVQSIALFYGAHPYHWYLSQGLPLMLFTYIPFTLYGLWHQTTTTTRALAQLVIWMIGVYSLLSHKEFRFLYPIFPVLLIFTAHGLYLIWRQQQRKIKYILVTLVGLSQVALAIYVSLWHQRGVMDVMAWLNTQDSTGVGFLMPCHSTPWQSALHNRPMESLWFLTCEPPLDQENNTYLDQADQFYANPALFLSTWTRWPDTLVMFDQLLTAYPDVASLLKQEHGYMECQRFFNTHVHWDSRRKGDVVAFCKKQ
ncbi:Alg9-like mannosyltransferase family-domain-containing protein [Chlamydoabsidia padenii]|nr:Alg9-like mannosyltransferase family-domain-containing protein [Chlamydoabsidia padenii]